MEKAPINFNEKKLGSLRLQKARLMAEIAEINMEMQRIEQGMAPKGLTPIDLSPVTPKIKRQLEDLDQDSMYRPSKFVDPTTQGYIETLHGLHRGRDRNGDSLFRRQANEQSDAKQMEGPPYEGLIQ